jgi:hypothetical protein
MNSKQHKALEAKAQKKIKAIMMKYPLFKDTTITITFQEDESKR